MIETRNEYGFPVVGKIEQAREYAAAARERNKPGCDCEACRQNEMLPAVLQLIQNWRTKK